MFKLNHSLRPSICILLFCATAFLITGCSSDFMMIYPEPPDKYEKLGPAEGSATGSLLGILHASYTYCIPMRLNSRLERAYQDALKSVTGATGLINVEIEEDWYWWVFGLARTTTIAGEAIREIE